MEDEAAVELGLRGRFSGCIWLDLIHERELRRLKPPYNIHARPWALFFFSGLLALVVVGGGGGGA